MKQKLLNNILYVFDVNPYEITSDTDAEVIKVQEESYAGFVEMNESLAEKIVKYNYHVMCVNVPEWAPYVEQPDPQETLTFGIYGTAAEASIAQVQRQDPSNIILETWGAGINLNFPFQAVFNVGEHFAVEFVNGVNPDTLDITGDALSISWQDAETNNFWKATEALTSSTSVGIDAVVPPATYKLYLSENATSQGISDENLRVTTNSVQVALTDLQAGIDVAEDTLVEVWLLTEDASDYNTSSISQWMNLSTENGLHYWRNMPAEDKTIEINLVQTVTISGDAPLTYIKELSRNKSTTINTYNNPTLPVTLTVTWDNILALSAGDSSVDPRHMYVMTPRNFASSSWTDTATGDKCSITQPIREDKSCELLQKRTLSLSGTDINNGNLKVTLDDVPQDLVELVNGKLVNPGATINVWLLTENVSDYDVTSIETWMTQSTDGGLHYTATMPQADKQINIPYVGTPLTPYTLSLTGTGLDASNLEVKLGGIEQSLTDLTDNGVTAYTTLMVEVNLLKTDNLAYYDTSSISQWMTPDPQDTSHYTAMMPAANTTINISYSVPSYTLSLTGTGINMTNLEVTLNEDVIALTDLENGVQANLNDDIAVYLLDNDLSRYDTSSISQWMTQDPDDPTCYEAQMPAANTVIDISYTVPE